MTKTFNTVGAVAAKAPKTVKVVTPAIELPAIGQGASFGWGSDYYPATVISRTAKTVTIQADHYEHVEGTGNFMSGNPQFTFTPNHAGSTHVVRLTKRGWRSNTGGHVGFGGRRFYQNPSF